MDKAFYGLKADNKLTAKQVTLSNTHFIRIYLSLSNIALASCLVSAFQVFSTMQSYDLGCSYGGGADSASVLIDAGLSFVSQANSNWRRGTKNMIFHHSFLSKCSFVTVI